MQKYLMIFIVSLLFAITAACGAEQTFVKIGDVVYGASPDEQGPIGGGNGYKHIITNGDFIATNVDSLLDVLSQAKAGQVVFIPGETEIDLTTRIYVDEIVLTVPEGVTLAGERGWNGSKGALLLSDALKTPTMILAAGPDVRVTGLRIQGPCSKRHMEHHRRSFAHPGGLGSSYYYQFPISYGISTAIPNLEVDNCEISAFNHTAIRAIKEGGHHVHHNYIHHCQYNGLGYGIGLERGATSLIEFNLFDYNRHSIAGDGRPGGGFIARNNVELGVSLSHCFDMHGGRDRRDGTDIAGTSIEIYNNTFRAPTKAVGIRGVPQEKCDVYHNWFQAHHNVKEAVFAEDKTTVKDNAYGEKPEKAE